MYVTLLNSFHIIPSRPFDYKLRIHLLFFHANPDHANMIGIARFHIFPVCLNTCNSFICKNVFSPRSEEHTSELQSRGHLVCRLLLEKKKKSIGMTTHP